MIKASNYQIIQRFVYILSSETDNFKEKFEKFS